MQAKAGMKDDDDDEREPSEPLALSSATLAALKAFVKEQGVATEHDDDDNDDDDPDGVLSAVQQLVQQQRGARDTDDDTAPKPVVIKYDEYVRTISAPLYGPATLRLALIAKHHSLWAEFVYNAARVLSDKIDAGEVSCRGKTVLELGAGAGLPGVVCALCGASVVCISDYVNEVDDSLLKAIDINLDMVKECFSQTPPPFPVPVVASCGYTLGYPVDKLLDHVPPPLPPPPADVQQQPQQQQRLFDVILLADLIFNRSEHRKLLWTVQQCMHPDGVAWVTFSHHDPHKRDLDLNFFRFAESDDFSFVVTMVDEEQRESYPFRENDGMDEQRGKVYTYKLERRK
jgi:nicotinamide N-methyltransferase